MFWSVWLRGQIPTRPTGWLSVGSETTIRRLEPAKFCGARSWCHSHSARSFGLSEQCQGITDLIFGTKM